MSLLTGYLVLPYRLFLALMTPWGRQTYVRNLGTSALGWFLWLNTLWVIAPVMLIILIATGSLTWLDVVGMYVAALVVLHSAIAHSADAVLRAWLRGLPPDSG